MKIGGTLSGLAFTTRPCCWPLMGILVWFAETKQDHKPSGNAAYRNIEPIGKLKLSLNSTWAELELSSNGLTALEVLCRISLQSTLCLMVLANLLSLFSYTLQVTETGVEVLTARLPSSPDVYPWLKPSSATSKWCKYNETAQLFWSTCHWDDDNSPKRRSCGLSSCHNSIVLFTGCLSLCTYMRLRHLSWTEVSLVAHLCVPSLSWELSWSIHDLYHFGWSLDNEWHGFLVAIWISLQATLFKAQISEASCITCWSWT